MSLRRQASRIGGFLSQLENSNSLRKFTIKDSKTLDPTKIPSWSLVRYPPVDPKTVIQGKPRNPASVAYKEYQKLEGARLRKALNRITHGRNIFVYNNLRTNQVVYSLTRYLEKNTVLAQMIFHGKKTVPATLRKDVWVPFYSVHFDDAKVGLRAYHLLREFSKQRQLAPPREMVTITQEWLDKRKPRNPEKVEEFEEEWKDRVGSLMKPRDRARAVMDQKATSVADVAAVIAIQEEEIANGFASGKRGYITRKARKRRRHARKLEQEATEAAAKRVGEFEKTLQRAADIKIEDPTGVGEYAVEAKQVKILWNDLHDAQYARSWPERVSHGELELARDHILPGQKGMGEGVIAHGEFVEKEATP
ncbi:transcriptional regulation of mitochondrial recombination-domain-containing protein [Talaromyces proteolyticus]|uniref:Large ribosomal subunit protein mL67 n=1 Tax=Talaromyces proteolyticus TaxID=1131652 RepID=A0AAD4L2B0_9EURO|nr:transcriptional regulation of mitochondrial recombination-domain-containing protein [Talaromyces proteolyticus]KAH8705321.1 transcriptional regulation of mitochondrial recombination-domain-containing protein [Talaromyces proteolyticus]